jgi:hypothetical protein
MNKSNAFILLSIMSEYGDYRLDKKAREEIARIVDEKIRKALLPGGLITNAIGKDVKRLRKDLDAHFKRHSRAFKRRKQA